MKQNDLKNPTTSPTSVGNLGGNREVFKTTNAAGNSSFSDRANGLNRGQKISDRSDSLSNYDRGKTAPSVSGFDSLDVEKFRQAKNFGNHVIPEKPYDGPTNLRDAGVAIRRGVTEAADYATRPARIGARAFYGGVGDLATGIFTNKTTAQADADSLASGRPTTPDIKSELSQGRPGQTSVDGVGYKNIDGNDIYETTNSAGNRSYSDHGVLTDDQKLAAGKIDKSAAPVELTNIVDSTFFKGPEGLGRRQEAALDPRVKKARAEAMARGDYKAAERSLMSNSELEQAKSKERMDRGRQAAYERDPVNAYATDQNSLAAYRDHFRKQGEQQYQARRDQVDDGYRDDSSILKRNLAISKLITEMESAMQFPKDATLMQKREIAEQIFDGNSNALSGDGDHDPEIEAKINSYL